MCGDEPRAEAHATGKRGPTGVRTAIKQTERKERQGTVRRRGNGNEKGGTRRSGDGASDHVITSLTLRVTMPTVPDPISRPASGWSEGAYQELGMMTRVVQ
jgi:hypothetical protein